MGLVYLPRFSEIPAKGNPIGMAQLLSIIPEGDRGLTFARSNPEGIEVGKIPGYWTCPYLATITGVILNTDQGGYVVKFWKGRSRSPILDDSINIDGYAIRPPDTHVELFSLTDFTNVDVLAGDTFAVEIVELFDPIPTDIAGNVIFLKREEELA